MSINNSLDSGLEQSKYQDFVAFTSTFYKDYIEGKVRIEAFFEMIENAQKLGIRVVVGDGGSGIDFLERISGYSNVTLIHSGKGSENTDLTMAGERRFTGKKQWKNLEMLRISSGSNPRKQNSGRWKNIDAILLPMREGSADIVVPSRKSKETLPSQQRAAENRANKRAMNIINYGYMGSTQVFKNSHFTAYHGDASAIIMDKGIYSDNSEYDLGFGPKAFTRKSMEEDFLSYTGVKWDGVITSVLAGKQRGKNVINVPVDFTYPPEQTQLETDPVQAELYQKKIRVQYRYIIRTAKDLVLKHAKQ